MVLGVGGSDGVVVVWWGAVCLVLVVVLCGGEPTNITRQLWSFLFLFLFPRLPPGILLLVC